MPTTEFWKLVWGWETSSLMAYEAVILNKSVIRLSGVDKFLDGSILDDEWDFKNSGAVVNISDLSQLRNAVFQTLYDPSFSDTLEKNRIIYTIRHFKKGGEDEKTHNPG